MNFAWNDFLALANYWATNAATSNYPQALYRSIISRAYYAAFHTAFALAQAKGLESTISASDHFRVRKFFQNRSRGDRQLSNYLYDLYDLRIVADYEIDESNPVTNASAQQALALAQKATDLVAQLDTN